MPRQIQDASTQVKVTIALPNAANTVNTSVIDLGNNSPFSVTESIGVQISTGLATGANSKNINVALADSNESNANFTNIAVIATEVVAGNATKYPASSINIALPPTVKRYIRGTATGEANGGDASDANLTVQLRF